MTWKCPKCGSTRLQVAIETTAILTQTEDNFETEVVGDHEWGSESYMQCLDCCHGDCAGEFSGRSEMKTIEQLRDEVINGWVDSCWGDRSFLKSLLQRYAETFSDEDIRQAHEDAFGAYEDDQDENQDK